MARSATAERQLEGLRAALERHGQSERAAREARYLASDLEFLGVSLPTIRREAQAFARSRPELDRAGLRALAEAAWASRVHELRSVAIGILERCRDTLTAADAAWLMRLVEHSNTWAHVDWLSIKVIGALTARHGALAASLELWARHGNFWVRRAALLSFHDALRAGGGDFEHFARLAVPMLGEREFFIRKAIGWVLRSVAHARPELVAGFVGLHVAALSGLTFREATRRLPTALQKRLEAERARSLAGARSTGVPIRAKEKRRRAPA